MDRIARLRPASTAEALRELRTAFPEIPLAARVTALEAMRRADAGSSNNATPRHAAAFSEASRSA